MLFWSGSSVPFLWLLVVASSLVVPGLVDAWLCSLLLSSRGVSCVCLCSPLGTAAEAPVILDGLRTILIDHALTSTRSQLQRLCFQGRSFSQLYQECRCQPVFWGRGETQFDPYLPAGWSVLREHFLQLASNQHILGNAVPGTWNVIRIH